MTGKRKKPPSSSRKLSKQKVHPTFKEADVYQYCLMKICTSLIGPLFRQLLRWFHPRWKSETEAFITYLNYKHITEIEFTERMNYSQKKDIKDDPFGKSWDITLSYYAIWYPWTKATHELGYLLTALKNERNKVAHLRKDLNNIMYKERCKAIHNYLKELLSKVRHYCPHVTQKEIDEKIKEARSFMHEIMNSPVKQSGFDPSKYEEYKKEMEEHKKCVITEGKNDLHERNRKRNCLEVTSYLALKKSLPVEETYVDMVLHEQNIGKKTCIEVKDLLDGSDSVYYLEGRAGVGKTSLIKYLSMVWTNGKGEVKGLEEYDLFFQLSFRDHISSFDQFLTLSMPTVIEKMSIDTLHCILFGLRSIIIFDGYDEKNKESAKLLKEILSRKKDSNFTLLVTSRPEATKQFYELVKSHGVGIKHINVRGIPKSKQTEFLQKYAVSLGCSDDIEPLLRYVAITKYRLSELWELPYNLSILIILWMTEPAVIDNMTTSVELHWQMHQVYKSKLRERLLNYHDTKHLPLSVLDRKLEDFLYVLCEISLTAIVNNDINLPPKEYETLLKKCEHLKIPTEELIGAFLKPSQNYTGGTYYSYHHKGVIDFLSALFIHKKLDSNSHFDIDQIQQQFANDLTCSNAPEDLRQQMKVFFDNYKMQYGPLADSGPHVLQGGKIRKILDEVSKGAKEKDDDVVDDADDEDGGGDDDEDADDDDGSGDDVVDDPDDDHDDDDDDGGGDDDNEQRQVMQDLSKFHNMLRSLIGILCIEGRSGGVYNDTKKEALELLRETGVEDKDDWLHLLNDLKCDEFVATFIAHQTDILKEEIKINDINLFAYNSVFKVIKCPLNDKSLIVEIRVKESIKDVGDFLSQINRLKLQVGLLEITDDNIEEYASLLRNVKAKFVNTENVDVRIEMISERKPLKDVWKALQYNGLHVNYLDLECDFESSSTSAVKFDENVVIKEIIPSCQVYRMKLQDESWDEIFDSLTMATKLHLDIFFRTDISPTIRQIPKGVEALRIYITDITDESEVENIGNILRGFDRAIDELSFPRCRFLDMEMILDCLSGIRVLTAISFPDYLLPDLERETQLDVKANASTGCTFGIFWRNEEEIRGLFDDW